MLALKAENISKQYRLGEVGTGTLSHDLNKFWYKVRGKENPYLKIGEANDRSTKGISEYVWSLKNINFEIEQGSAVGIIGRNGAGKSTLLKLLSKVTKPTTGKIFTNGRIASLLEVGTGFHPEMTGRENVYLNGAILGMSRKEIKRKFDEIVDFSGVERYIDTPVKRYSSGMYVRLAFAVAAHLESEILIVDEVLAVGDAEFQKKCLGKMGDVSKGEGRTVLFVSHNLAAVRRLCNTGILLKNGEIISTGKIDGVLNRYDMEFASAEKNFVIDYPLDESKDMQILKVELQKPYDHNRLFTEDVLEFNFDIVSRVPVENAYITIDIKNNDDDLIYWTSDYTSERFAKPETGNWNLKCMLPKNLLTTGFYTATFAISSPSSNTVVDHLPKYQIAFEIEEDESSFLQQYGGVRPGKTGVESSWKSKKISL
ncbi:MAG: transporter ATP-binding protein [Chryseobacterium sp.]|jgi:lipopolysaccharide transport system ATP-binding protein|uniref:ABC transporter ATP-binding protein n=1 Tax=Chryseobacterium sp. TaxID=1871047 RepID=UPI002611F5C1|nr:polysaccharide ABC transporter ATP-binding protein [Chryseobacterium sp.]MDF2552047.1 transporter ATP-binding protein [Chryseobacterium sp.]